MSDNFHSHRNLIGFDENGIPTIIKHRDNHNNHLHNADGSSEDENFISDYMEAVSTYKKTFPSKAEVYEKTPDPAIKELLKKEEELSIDNPFDRFDKQKPQCSYGIAGICCKICSMGPCRISKKSPRGVCGADADLIVARNLLRNAAAGASQHGMHAREIILELKRAAEGKLDHPIIGIQKVKDTAKSFGINIDEKTDKEITLALTDELLKDLSNPDPNREYKTITAIAPKERSDLWRKMGILPISAYHEVFDSYHRTGVGTDGDWESIMEEFLRVGLAFTFTGVVGTSIATDCLFGVGDRVTSKVNVGALEKDYVNIAVHGHLPLLVKEIVKAGKSEAMIKLAKTKGAKGIKFYGICCSGLSAMYRYAGVIPLSNAVSAELVIATGALDLWVADVQDVFPAIMDVANCFKTTVVTTSDQARLPGAEKYEFDHYHSNIKDAEALGEKIVKRAIRSFEERKDVPVTIPSCEIEAEVGFSNEYLQYHYGSLKPLAWAIKNGNILGIVNLVGCSNPRVPFERNIVDVTDILIKNNILVLTNGCASYPLMKMGYCKKDSSKFAGDNLRKFLGDDMPAVWHVGECIDNARSSTIMTGIAKELGIDLKDMPFAFSSPEWANEKGIDAALGFRLLGINSYHNVEAPIWGSKKVIKFLKEDTKKTLGSSMIVDVNPKKLANRIVEDFKEKRKKLGRN